MKYLFTVILVCICISGSNSQYKDTTLTSIKIVKAGEHLELAGERLNRAVTAELVGTLLSTVLFIALNKSEDIDPEIKTIAISLPITICSIVAVVNLFTASSSLREAGRTLQK